jgi:hypothetical protein
VLDRRYLSRKRHADSGLLTDPGNNNKNRVLRQGGVKLLVIRRKSEMKKATTIASLPHNMPYSEQIPHKYHKITTKDVNLIDNVMRIIYKTSWW